MRTRSFVLVSATASLIAGSLLASAAAASTPLNLDGRGLSILHLGASETRSVTTLTRVLGRPSAPFTATPALRLCGVSATVAWTSMNVFFNHNRLVGMSFGPGHSPSIQTAAGLKLGDPLSRARTLYGKGLTTSPSQGGVWFVTTSAGRIGGFLNPSTAAPPASTAKIWTIDVGVVGCPAESP